MRYWLILGVINVVAVAVCLWTEGCFAWPWQAETRGEGYCAIEGGLEASRTYQKGDWF